MTICMSAAGFPVPAPVPVQNFSLTITETPVVGKALNYSAPANAGTILSQQWYRNNGSGPVLIAGAVGATYTPVVGDAGYFISVRALSTTGIGASTEFPASNTVLSQTTIQTKASPQSGLQFIFNQDHPVTALAAITVRASVGTNYIDTTLAPGTYSSPTQLGDLTAFAAQSGTAMGIISVSSTPVVLAQVTDTTASTATRPAYNTGSGFFVKGSAVYDANGARFRHCGNNRTHYDSGSNGIWNASFNSIRIGFDLTRSFSSGGNNAKGLLDQMVSNQVVPIPAIFYCKSSFTATIAGTTMTVTAMTVGTIAPGFSNGANTTLTGTGIVGSNIAVTAQLTNTNSSGIPGKEGTYTVSATQTISTPTTLNYQVWTSGYAPSTVPIACAQNWADQVASFSAYDRWSMINICNEWGGSAFTIVGSISGTVLTVTSATASIGNHGIWNGPGVTPFTIVSRGTGTGGAGTYNIDVSQSVGSVTLTEVTWRDSYISAVSVMRTAGYKGTIVIDAPGSGQDSGPLGSWWTIINHGPAVLAADPQQNVIFSAHIYGNAKPGTVQSLVSPLQVASSSNGCVYIVGEFGPGRHIGPSPSVADPLEVVATCAANNLGFLSWSWDDNDLGGGTSDDFWFAFVFKNGSGYATSDPADLTTFGKAIVLNPTYYPGSFPKATVFP